MSKSLLGFLSSPLTSMIAAGKVRSASNTRVSFQGLKQSACPEETYPKYLQFLSVDALLESPISMLLERGDNEQEEVHNWLKYWERIAHNLFPDRFGFCATTESVTVPPDDRVFRRLFSWPVNYIAICKVAQRQQFGIIYSHNPALHVSDSERIRQALVVSADLGHVLLHLGRAGRRTNWIHTFGHEFVCVDMRHLRSPILLQERTQSITSLGSVAVLRTLARKISRQKTEQLFKEIPTGHSGEYIMVAVN